MHVESEIKKWGNSLALRITGAMAEIPNFQVGTKVDIEIKEDSLIIKPLCSKKQGLKLPFSEKQLVSNLTPALAHVDMLASPTLSEFGE